MVTPVIINLLDGNQEMHVTIDFSDEEEKNETNSTNDEEPKIESLSNYKKFLSIEIDKSNTMCFQSKNYLSNYLSNTTPPPELI